MPPTKFQFIWPSGFREDFLRNQPLRNKNCLWRPGFLTIWDEMRNLYREPSMDAFYEISLHLGKWFQRRFFRNQPSRNKNCLLRPCLLTYRDEISKPSIDASYKVSLHLDKRFQRRTFYKIGQSETRIACGSHVC